jgi:FAD synthase
VEWSPPSRALQSPTPLNSSVLQIAGVVHHGDHRGRLIGFPTANIAMPQGATCNGVWGGTVRLNSQSHRSLYVAAISIGDRPTYYSKGQSLLEASLLDYDGDLYGQTLVVTIHTLIRSQRKFAGTPELVDQLQDDVARVRNWALRTGLGGYLREDHEANLTFQNPESTYNRSPGVSE